MGKFLSEKQLQKALFERTEGCADNVRKIYEQALGEIIDLVKGTELEDGVPFSFADYGYGEAVTPILRNMYSRTYQTIKKGVQTEWEMSNQQNDELVKSIFGEKSIEDNHYARYFQRNKDAMDAFFARKTGSEGLNLSQKVWKYTGAYKDEMESTIELAMGEGTPANRMATQVKKYLNDPDRWYRRFRVKIGEDENGNPIYGYKWKRRVWDKESNSYKWIDSDPKKYHPGKGVYRSSARNAQRLARTETNIAYRDADFTRWQQLDFVVGTEIKLSNNHPDADICDDLKGVYPKDFKWTGWHPNCRCYSVPKLATQKEMDNLIDTILSREDPASVEIETETELPDRFTSWMRENKDRYEKAQQNGTVPYFLRDNKVAVEKVLYGLTPDEKKALSFGDILVNPLEILSKYGMADLESLHAAVQSKLNMMLTGDLTTQKSTLEFEINWVKDHKKYATWKEAVDAYQKALDKVNSQIEKRSVENLTAGIDSFVAAHPKSKKIKDLQRQIREALAADDLSKARNLIAQADQSILDYNIAVAKKLAKAGTKSIDDIEKYCDAHRTFEYNVFDQDTFQPFQDKRISEMLPSWMDADKAAREAVARYTGSEYYDINRSYYYHKTECKLGKLMDSILDKCVLTEDVVVRHGCDMSKVDALFGTDFGALARSVDVAALNKRAGARAIHESFISTSFERNGGFNKSVELRIYCSKGTNAIYAKPISGYNDALGARFDGTNHSKRFVSGTENEIIVHRGYEFRFIKAEAGGVAGEKITLFVELLTREKRVVK